MRQLPSKVYTSKNHTSELSNTASKQTKVSQTQPVENILHDADIALDEGNFYQSLWILDRAIEANVGDSQLVSQLVTAKAKIYIITKEYQYALDELNYVLELQPENEDAKNAKEILIEKISYHKKLTAHPLYS